MNRNSSLSLARIMQLAKYYVSIEKEKFFIYSLVAAIVIQLPYILMLIYYFADSDLSHPAYQGFDVISFSLTVLLLHIAPIMLTSNLRGRQGCAMQLTLPASDMEKFIVRLLFCTIGALSVILLAHALGVGIYYATLKFTGAADIHYGLMASYGLLVSMVNFYEFFLLCYSCYFLGAVYWKRHSFIKSFILHIVASPLLLMLTVGLVDSLAPRFTSEERHNFIVVLCLLLLCACWWLIYRKFRRIQIMWREKSLLLPILLLLGIYAALYLLVKWNDYKSEFGNNNERLERITAVEFPPFYKIGGDNIQTTYAFDELPSENFYAQLDSIAAADSSYWKKQEILRDSKNPDAGTIEVWHYERYWGRDLPVPDDESYDWKALEVTIYRGVKGFKTKYFSWGWDL